MERSNTENIMKFQPMPKRFMVWDKTKRSFCRNTTDGKKVFDLIQLANFLISQGSWGTPHTNFEFLQSTNLFDKDGNEIFEGSIVRRAWEAAGDGDDAPLFLVVWSPTLAEFAFKYGIFHSGVEQIIDKKALKDVVVVGHILSNPELLEEKNV